MDLLDLEFRVEQEFNIQISSDSMMALLESGTKQASSEGAWTDLRVSTFVEFVESVIKTQRPEMAKDVFERVQQQIAECLSLPIESVTVDAWMVSDLGME